MYIIRRDQVFILKGKKALRATRRDHECGRVEGGHEIQPHDVECLISTRNKLLTCGSSAKKNIRITLIRALSLTRGTQLNPPYAKIVVLGFPKDDGP